jgi:hypothetical protein
MTARSATSTPISHTEQKYQSVLDGLKALAPLAEAAGAHSRS